MPLPTSSSWLKRQPRGDGRLGGAGFTTFGMAIQAKTRSAEDTATGLEDMPERVQRQDAAGAVDVLGSVA